MDQGLSPRLRILSTIGLLSLCIVAVGFLFFIFMKIPFGGAYTVTYATLAKVKAMLVGLFGFLLLCRAVDAVGERQRSRRIPLTRGR